MILRIIILLKIPFGLVQKTNNLGHLNTNKP